MRALLLKAPGQLELTDLPRPALELGQVRVRVRRVGVCGSDYSSIAGKLPFTRFPIVPGHEAAGVVIEARTESWRPGDRVLIHPILCDRCDPAFGRGELHHAESTEVLGVVSRNGAYAEEVVVEDYMLRPLPAGVDDESAAMIEPVAVAVRALEERAAMKGGDRVLVFGAGNIGLLVIQVARVLGAARVVVTDLVDAKLVLARLLGADEALNVSDGFPASRFEKQFDVVVDGVGSEQTVRDALIACVRGGRIVVYGVPPGEIVFPLKAAFAKDVMLAASRLYGDSFQTAISLVAHGLLRLGELVTHRVKLEEAPALIARIISGRERAIKVMIEL